MDQLDSLIHGFHILGSAGVAGFLLYRSCRPALAKAASLLEEYLRRTHTLEERVKLLEAWSKDSKK